MDQVIAPSASEHCHRSGACDQDPRLNAMQPTLRTQLLVIEQLTIFTVDSSPLVQELQVQNF